MSQSHPCIPRDDMPQVDWVDMPGLLAYLQLHHNVHILGRRLPPTMLRMVQCARDTRPTKFSNPILRRKPLLIALDLEVLDGNGRLMGYLRDNTPEVNCIQLNKPFDEAMKAIFQYEHTYRYGDGPQPYRV